MERAMRSRKRVFWEALLIAILVFGLGIIAGVAYENHRLSDINEKFASSEISLIDSIAMKDLLMNENENLSCKKEKKFNVQFADRIYNESLKLSSYRESNKLTDDLRLAHKKYDALRTILWMTNKELYKKCGDYTYAVYLYNYSSQSTQEEAQNDVWSKILYDFKQKKGNDLVLIPIAANSELASLDALMSNYEIDDLPVVILNDEHIIRELESAEQLVNKTENKSSHS